MPHVAFVPFTGLRIAQQEMLQFGMSLPGLRSRADAISELPSLGLLTLAGMLNHDWTSSYHPSAATNDLLGDVVKTNPQIVAVSALTASVLEAYRFCDELRKLGIHTVIGGLHASVKPDEASRHADSVCVGDGESSWLTILNDAQHDRLRSVYQSERPFDLSESPLPDYRLLKNRTISRWTLQTQRGCPWACEFCGASRLLGPSRAKPIARIEREIASIKALDHTPWIELADDNSFADRKDVMDLLQMLGSANIRYFTENDWRIGEMPQLIPLLAQSGCVQVLIGIESIGFRYPGMGKKDEDWGRLMAAIDIIQDSGIVVNGCFIVGADGETNASLDRLTAFVNQSSLAEVQITLQTPFPGTGLFRRLAMQDRILRDRDWSHYNLFDIVYQPDQLTIEELESGFRRVLSSVFSDQASRRRAQIRREVWRRHPGFKASKS